jgi:hypothetical protein
MSLAHHSQEPLLALLESPAGFHSFRLFLDKEFSTGMWSLSSLRVHAYAMLISLLPPVHSRRKSVVF